MTRRGFLSRLVGAIAAAAVTANLVREEEMSPDVSGTKFDPVNYVGEYRWINIKALPEDTGRFRGYMVTPI